MPRNKRILHPRFPTMITTTTSHYSPQPDWWNPKLRPSNTSCICVVGVASSPTLLVSHLHLHVTFISLSRTYLLNIQWLLPSFPSLLFFLFILFHPPAQRVRLIVLVSYDSNKQQLLHQTFYMSSLFSLLHLASSYFSSTFLSIYFPFSSLTKFNHDLLLSKSSYRVNSFFCIFSRALFIAGNLIR